MGLAFSHGDADMTYSNFNNMRRALAKHYLDIDLNEMDGYTSSGNVAKDWLRIDRPPGNDWEPYKEHDLFPLLNHSDCGGHMSAEEMKKVLPLLNVFSNQGDLREHINAGRLAQAMMEALSECEALEFF